MRVGGLIQAPGRPGEIRHGRGWRGRPPPAFAGAVVAAPYGSDFSAPGPRDSYGRENANLRRYGGPKAPLAAAIGSGGVYLSGDLVSWTLAPTPIPGDGIAYSPTLGLYAFVRNIASTQNIATSPDGVTWTVRTKPNGEPLTKIVWNEAEQIFAALVSDTAANPIVTSADGVNWTARTFDGAFWNEGAQIITAGGSAVYMFGTDGGSIGCAVSPNGTSTYLRQDTVNSAIVDNACFDTARSRFCTHNLANNVWTSPTCLTGSWTQRAAAVFPGGPGTYVRGWAYCPASDRIVAGGNGFLWTSADGGVTWGAEANPLNRACNSIRWLPTYEVLVAVAAAGAAPNIAISPDGQTWTAVNGGIDAINDVTII